MKSTASKSQHWDFLAMKVQSSSISMKELVSVLVGQGNFHQPARDRLVKDAENPADSSHLHLFKIELTDLLLEG